MSDSSISKDVRETCPEDWPKWVLKSLTELSRSETCAINHPVIKAYPSWVQSMVVELLKPMMPNLTQSTCETWPGFLGTLLGHQDYLLSSDEAGDAFERSLKKMNEADQRADEFLKSKLSEEAYGECMAFAEKFSEHFNGLLSVLCEVLTQKDKVIQRCMKRALLESFELKVAFLKAYVEAAGKPLFNEFDRIEHATSRTKIYAVLILYYPVVTDPNHIRSMPELHRWVSKMLGEPHMTFDRVRKLCNEHGLSYAD